MKDEITPRIESLVENHESVAVLFRLAEEYRKRRQFALAAELDRVSRKLYPHAWEDHDGRPTTETEE